MKLYMSTFCAFHWRPQFYRGRWYDNKGYGNSYTLKWLGVRFTLNLLQDYPHKDSL